jgi:hypothetical protein
MRSQQEVEALRSKLSVIEQREAEIAAREAEDGSYRNVILTLMKLEEMMGSMNGRRNNRIKYKIGFITILIMLL